MKKVLYGSMALLVFIIGIVVIIGADFVSKESEKRYIEDCTGTLRYLVDVDYNRNTYAKFYDEIELDEDAIEELYYLSKKVENKLILDNSYNIYDGTYKYVATVCGEDFSFTETEGVIYYSYKKIDNEEIYEDIMDVIEDAIDDIDKIYLFNVGSYSYSYYVEHDNIQISDKDQKLLYNYYEDTDFNPEPVNLIFKGKYVLLIDDDIITFDNLDGYALVNNKMVFLSRDFRLILGEYLNLTVPVVNIDKLPSDANVSIRLVKHNDVYSVSESDRRQIIEYWNGTNKNKIIKQTVSMDAVSYLFVLGDNDVTFGYIEGKDYVYYNGQGLYVDSKVKNYLAKVVESSVTPKEPECCSCCPDLKPGEYCNDACCPCAD